jgi:antitoxin (DNA-binding transcriptional repressor) of toxin-antitoxin stability system
MGMVNTPKAKSSLSRPVDTGETGVEQEIVIARNGRLAAGFAPVAQGRRLGVAEGHFVVPDTIDADCDEIARLFADRME